jgi:hypothetical protein
MTAQSISQTPDPLNITLRQNQEWAIDFSYCNDDVNGNPDLNSPIDLTGYVPLLQFRTSALARTTVLSLTVGNGITFNPTTCPQVRVNTGITTPPGKYEWDLKLTPANEEAIYLGRGTVEVDAEVSR